jgi:ribosomal protein S18 acetylase RimI-like enzyme
MELVSYENEVETHQRTKNSISIMDLQSFNNDLLEKSYTGRQEAITFSDLKVTSSLGLMFTTKFSNKIFLQLKKQFLVLFKVTYPEEFFKKVHEKKYHTVIGLEAESHELVSFCVIDINKSEHKADILALGVLKEYQGKGVGSRLLQKVLEELTLLGISEVGLIVQAVNINAIRLYNKFGFLTTDMLPSYYYYLSGEDSKAFSMQKNIVKKQFWVFNVFRKITERLFNIRTNI